MHCSTGFSSINVPEIQVLPIRQIPKRRCIQVSALQTTFLRPLNPIPPLILPLHQKPKRHNQHHLNQMTHNHTPDPQRIRRRLTRLVKERPRDVPRTIPQEEHRVRHHLLRVPRRIRDLQGQYHDERRVVRTR